MVAAHMAGHHMASSSMGAPRMGAPPMGAPRMAAPRMAAPPMAANYMTAPHTEATQMEVNSTANKEVVPQTPFNVEKLDLKKIPRHPDDVLENFDKSKILITQSYEIKALPWTIW